MSQLPGSAGLAPADCPEQQRWLVDGLWSEEAVGIIGGEPKCCKSFLALDLAVAVAAGVPCLRRFAVSRPGPSCSIQPKTLCTSSPRLEGIRAAAGASLAELDVQVITASSLPSISRHRARLTRPSPGQKPRLLVLTRSCACIASMRMSAATWHRCSPSCASYSAAMPSPSLSSTMPGRELALSAPARPCADRRNSTHGAIPPYLPRQRRSHRPPSSIAPRCRAPVTLELPSAMTLFPQPSQIDPQPTSSFPPPLPPPPPARTISMARNKPAAVRPPLNWKASRSVGANWRMVE